MGAQGGIDLFAILITIHVLICFGLIICVLMQSAKGEGLAGAFGGGGISGAVFGGRGAAPFLSKATTVLAIMYMSMCILLTLTTSGGRSTGATATSAVQQAAQHEAQMPQATTPADVPEVRVGQESQSQELPIQVRQNDAASQQDKKQTDKKKEEPGNR